MYGTANLDLQMIIEQRLDVERMVWCWIWMMNDKNQTY